ncbi:MAG: lysine 2,3-aminomutase [Bdellovibrionales bacterium GWB1_55_8]|nr:MAG: lysine 2,3-aminomutase [Bdellovibrionales bacterium GWB1_55_8]
MAFNIITKNTVRERFPNAPRPDIWKDTEDKDWNNWIWQQQKRIKSMDQLEKVIHVADDEREAFAKSHESFNMGITPYYASLIDKDDPNCPVRLQSVPKGGELVILPSDMEDPLAEERDMPTPGITHRYPDRVLFYTTHNCPVYCRHCTRKRKVADPSSSAANKQLEDGLAYIEQHKEVRDVVISGGDPLSNSDERLEYILSRLRAIEHVEVLRLGTRNLVTLPQRITDNFAQMVKKYHPLFIHTHFNHPKECTREAFDACAKLADAGCVIHNQMVLLKGVNDDPKIVKELNHKLLMMRVRPYYIFQCDMSQGISHFRTPIEAGINIIENLRGWTSGMAVPHFVVDAPGGGGKIPLLPNYLVKHEGKKWILRNYKNQQFTYEEP